MCPTESELGGVCAPWGHGWAGHVWHGSGVGQVTCAVEADWGRCSPPFGATPWNYAPPRLRLRGTRGERRFQEWLPVTGGRNSGWRAISGGFPPFSKQVEFFGLHKLDAAATITWPDGSATTTVPLDKFVEKGHKAFLTHPAVRALLTFRWRSFGLALYRWESRLYGLVVAAASAVMFLMTVVQPPLRLDSYRYHGRPGLPPASAS